MNVMQHFASSPRFFQKNNFEVEAKQGMSIFYTRCYLIVRIDNVDTNQ